MIIEGLIGFADNKKDLFPKLIKFFTGSKNTTHTFVTCKCQEVESVIEAGKLVQVVPFDSHYRSSKQDDYWLYRINPKKVDEKKIKFALSCVYKSLAGDEYGTFQLLWFPYRWLMKTVFKKDTKDQNNWFTKGVICSELTYQFLVYCDLGYLVKDFNANTIQAQDIRDICESNPDIFQLVSYKDEKGHIEPEFYNG